ALDKGFEAEEGWRDEELRKQRYRNIIVGLATHGGSYTIEVGDGMMMSGPFSVEGLPDIDLSYHPYACDLSKHQILVVGAAMREVARRLCEADGKLETALGEAGSGSANAGKEPGADVAEAAKASVGDADWLGQLSRAPWKLEANSGLAEKFAPLDFARARASKLTAR
ncbi:unnamed protein product, partial [Prorocentrum cordatum]